MLHVDLATLTGEMYTIVIQLGAISCPGPAFTGRILEFFRTFPQGEKWGSYHPHPPYFPDPWWRFVCTAVPSLLLVKLIGKHLESLRLMAPGPADWRHRDVAGGCLERCVAI